MAKTKKRTPPTSDPRWAELSPETLQQIRAEMLAHQVGNLVAASETHLARIIRKSIDADRGAPAYEVQRLGELAQYHAQLAQAVGEDWKAIIDAAQQVVDEAREAGQGMAWADLNEAGYEPPEHVVRGLDRIAADTLRTITGLPALVLRDVLDVYQQTMAAPVAQTVTGATTSRMAMRNALADYLARGISTFTDKTGRNWRIDSYVEMAVRTGAMHAFRGSYADQLSALGLDLVMVTGNEYTCRLCAPYQGKILSLSGANTGTVKVEHATRDGVMVPVTVTASVEEAKAKGLFHPNCTHVTRAFFPGLTTTSHGHENPTVYKASQKQRGHEREIRRLKRDLEATFAPDEQTKLRRQINLHRAKIRELVAEHEQLARLRYREANMKPGYRNPIPQAPSK